MAIQALREADWRAKERVETGVVGSCGDSGHAVGVRGCPPSISIPHFDRHVYLEFSFHSRQLHAIRRYIQLNPARAMWKQQHPDRFVRFSNIRHPVLDENHRWDAMGNLTLLASPFLFPVRLTLRKTVSEHESTIARLVEEAKCGTVLVSGFLSPGEVELLRRLKQTEGTRFIKLLPCAMEARYDPSAEDSRELATDRLLILTGFHDTQAISSLEMKRDKRMAHQFRENCLALNGMAEAICQRARYFGSGI